MKFKKSQSGRSMVEMLGVLAIIGVLSVGGIAGYSLSMRRHRANGVVDLASKFALAVYGRCQQRILDGGASLDGCGHGAADSFTFSDAGLGNLPAGVTGMNSWLVSFNPTTGAEIVEVFVDYTDQKLCQTVASIAGSECKNYGNSYGTTIKIKQN